MILVCNTAIVTIIEFIKNANIILIRIYKSANETH